MIVNFTVSTQNIFILNLSKLIQLRLIIMATLDAPDTVLFVLNINRINLSNESRTNERLGETHSATGETFSQYNKSIYKKKLEKRAIVHSCDG